MVTIKDVQNCQLEILKEVDRICECHKIPYYLACGTFLGAVRHKGFIPWDDDIDIYMRYDDLKRFKCICKNELSEKFFFQDFDTDCGVIWIFTKIRKNNTYMSELYGKDQSKISYHQGIWIDIFPLLDAADTPQKTYKQIKCIGKYHRAIAEYVKLRRSDYKNVLTYCYSAMYNLKCKFVAYFSKRKFEKLQSANSDKVLIMSNAYWNIYNKDPNVLIEKALKKTLLKEKLVMEKYVFEDTRFYGIKDYNYYLTQEYGADYMTPKQWSHLPDYSEVSLDTSSNL